LTSRSPLSSRRPSADALGLKAGDKIFWKKTEASYLLGGPKKNLLEYAGCLNSSYSIEEEEAKEGFSKHVLEDGKM
jgi:hypothetical protein